jgi:multisubunit Na+/H+ antiporter MnhF subunit
MNPWLAAAAILMAALVLPGIVCVVGRPLDGLVALELACVGSTLALLLVAEGLHRKAFADLAIVAAISSFVGCLAFVRLLSRGP